MNVSDAKPGIFIGSSVERLEIAYALQEHLEYVAEPTVWTQDIFKPSSYALLDLVNATRKFQFAIFVFAADDIVTLRNIASAAVRDNVVFEFGLFVGALGLNRCFLVMPRNTGTLHLPTDLLGLAPLTYAADRSDRNLVAAMGPAANRVRLSIREQQAKLTESEHADASHIPNASDRKSFVRRMTASGFLEIWSGPRLSEARAAVRELPSNPYGYDEGEVAAHEGLRRIFAFLEGVSDAVLSGEIDEGVARSVFERPVQILWPHMYTLLAPANHADEWWDPLPKLAQLHKRWSAPTKKQD